MVENCYRCECECTDFVWLVDFTLYRCVASNRSYRKKIRHNTTNRKTASRERPERKMFFCFCSTATRSWKGIVLLGAVAQSFQSAVVPQKHHLTGGLNAIAIPHDSSAWITPLDGEGSAPTRTKRINLVLEKARSRTGLDNASTGKTTRTRTDPVGEASAEVSSPISNISLDIENSIDTVLPFKLPQLSDFHIDQLMAGQIVQEQSEMGRQGSGFVVQVRNSKVHRDSSDTKGRRTDVHYLRLVTLTCMVNYSTGCSS